MINWIKDIFSTLDKNIKTKTITRRKCVGECFQIAFSTNFIKQLVNKINSFKLPLLERKWDKTFHLIT